MATERCPGHSRHWFRNYGEVGGVRATCVRCGAPNPRVVPEFAEGTRVEFRYGGAIGTVLRHDGRAGGGGTRRIVVRWDATRTAPERESATSSYNLKPIA